MKGKILKYWNSLNKKKKILLSIIVCLTLVEVSSLFLMYQSLINKNSLLDSVSLKNINKSNGMFAIYVEQEDGSFENALEVPSTETHEYNSSKSGCVDLNGKDLGDVLTYDVSNNMISAKVKGTAKCYIYFTLPRNDITVSVKTDGETGLPTSGDYKANLTCDTANAIFNEKYQRIEIGGISSNENRCTLNYTKADTSGYTLLRDEVESKANSVSVDILDFDNVTKLSQSEYGTITATYSGWDENWENELTGTLNMSYNDSMWSINQDNSLLLYDGTYNLLFSVSTSNQYQLCYQISSQETDTNFNFYVNDVEKYSGYVSYDNLNECIPVGEISSSDNLKLYLYTMDSIIPNISFRLEKIEIKDTEVHYRYDGVQPNNYLWFNNEIWKIIGSIPTKISEENSQNLVKIVRNNSLGVGMFDAKESDYSNTWGNNTLYNLLNQYYFGKDDATNTSDCDFSFANLKISCNYKSTGISSLPGDYYGKMIEEVYWNTGNVASWFSTPNIYYSNEIVNRITLAKIGLMSASDIAFASGSAYHNVPVGASVIYDIPRESYLNNVATEWTLTRMATGVSEAYYGGIFSYVEPNSILSFRPALYLKSNVYIKSGSGTALDPYVIGM